LMGFDHQRSTGILLFVAAHGGPVPLVVVQVAYSAKDQGLMFFRQNFGDHDGRETRVAVEPSVSRGRVAPVNRRLAHQDP
jgi:hypothetical protein